MSETSLSLHEQFRTKCRFLRSAFSTADGQRELAEGRPDSGPLVEQTMNLSNSRRTLMKRTAAVAAGSVGPVLAPGTTVELSATTRSPLSKAPTRCERGQAVRSDSATLVETSSGRIRGFKRNGVYTVPPRPLASAALRKTLKVQLQRNIA
jgi:hypothetical protein